ncbi:unnamed protein product [Macrosiphum euphorbiae]|uniref:DDE Tnp4 domain-containing protein n=3 Tax=Macrosiphum euphorbiae TaxID=13131 RepID=A0AAV0XKF9_9HEMI|nr:unnamed protein product [Macrosiphum euphorbiae]
MEKRQIAAMLFLYRRMKKRKRNNRLHWVHPILTKRVEFGAFYTLFPKLREHEDKFSNYFRMSTTSFDELHLKLKDCIQRQDTFMRECIQPVQMLAITLRYLASGCSFVDLHYTFLLGVSTISKIVRVVCCAIWSVLRLECIPEPDKDKWKSISQKFETRANFPNCIGAVDGKHVRIVHPLNSMHINYKGYSSIVLMAVADADYRFVYANIGAYGKDCDSNVFQKCQLWRSIVNDTMDIPEEKCLPGSQDKKIPYYLVGDEAFGLHKHLLKPYGGHSLTIKKRIFNYRLSRARRFVECTFGILSNKWRIFHRAINLDPDFATDIVKACVVLHNFVRDRDGFETEDMLSIAGLESDPGNPPGEMRRNQATASAKNVRDVLSNYFMTENGSVPWQFSKI